MARCFFRLAEQPLRLGHVPFVTVPHRVVQTRLQSLVVDIGAIELAQRDPYRLNAPSRDLVP